MEIKPKIVDGEPLGSHSCPYSVQYGSEIHPYYHCSLQGLAYCRTNDPCIPGLRQQRDELTGIIRGLQITACCYRASETGEDPRAVAKEIGWNCYDDENANT